VVATPTPNDACAASGEWVTNPSLPDFDTAPGDHCGFFQQAWQAFLYLASPSGAPGGALVFETYPATESVFSGGTVATGTQLFQHEDARTNRMRFFRPRVSKQPPRASDTGQLEFDPHQAGSNGILVDQTGNITYYEQFLDPGVMVPFIDACTLTLKTCQTQPGAQTLQIPAGSLELKVAWRPLWKTSAGVASFYTIPGFAVKNAAGDTVTPDFFGLVGFHLVYSLAGHPELIWGTFEHLANAPTGACAEGQTTCDALPAGASGWSYNDCNSTSCADINAWPSPTPTPPLPAAQAFLEYSEGTMASLTDAAGVAGQDNINIIQNLNQSVLGVLPPDSVWRNYALAGSLWTLNGALPALAPFQTTGEPNPGFNQVGSTFLANVTMETFTQFPNPVPSPYVNSVENCFTCHNTASSYATAPPATQKPPFTVSHAFSFAQSTTTCAWTTAVPEACEATQP
jgi:hypothetical protein